MKMLQAIRVPAIAAQTACDNLIMRVHAAATDEIQVTVTDSDSVT
jgi:hypothetical protein